VPDRLDTLATAIGRLDYDRALPALGRLLQALDGKRTPAPSDAKTADIIRMTMVQVAYRAYAKLPADGAIDEKIQLREAIKRWPAAQSTGLVAQLEADISDSSRACGRVADQSCDALRIIARRPDAEDGYRDLLRHYAADSHFVRAESAFTALSDAYRRSVWPRKILSEIEHEDLASAYPRYFRKSYDDALEVRRMPAFHDMASRASGDYRRIETDFAEVALSAGAYGDVQAVAEKILSSAPSPTERLNMTLFLYVASVMARDADSATARLARLSAVIDSLPSGFNNQWEYPGTRAFIRSSAVAPALKKALLDLCKEGVWYTRTVARAKIDDNRKALKLLGGL
jgi:hypothetical protein